MLSRNRGLRVAIVVLVVLVMFGLTGGAAADSHNGHERPFKAWFSGTVEIVVGADWCPALPWVGVVIVADKGHTTHLGPVSAEATQCTSTATGEVINGEATFFAANGDELYATYSGGPGSTAPVEVIQVFNGGTGRFANATGQATEWAYPNDPEAGLVWGVMEGTITYDASDRSR